MTYLKEKSKSPRPVLDNKDMFMKTLQVSIPMPSTPSVCNQNADVLKRIKRDASPKIIRANGNDPLQQQRLDHNPSHEI